MPTPGHEDEVIEEIEYPTGFGLKDVVGWGTTGLVVVDRASGTVIKTAMFGTDEHIANERRIYERFTERGGHPNLLRYHGPYERGIRLEHATKYHLASFAKNGSPEQVTPERRLRWAGQWLTRSLSPTTPASSTAT